MFHDHFDHASMYPRIVSASLFLNDDFEGGEFVFKEFNLTIKPKTGDILVFSSSFPYMHRVNPVKTGIRYAAVKWYEYP
jgi:predicted 2-oxoglutarate/Fe(II)-dependent dioxygenase YbiX